MSDSLINRNLGAIARAFQRYCAVVAGLLFSPMGFAGVAYVQGSYATPHPSASSVAVTYSAVAQGAGDLNVVAVGWCDTTSTVTSISDSKGNAYARAIGPTVVSGSASQSVYYAQNIAAAAAGANIVTVTFSGTVTCPDVRILEYSGVATSNALDVTVGGANATGTALSSGSLTTTNANDLLIGSSFIGQSPNGVGSGYTQRVLSSPNGNLEEDKIVSATGSYSATAAQTPSSWWIMQLTAFKAASSTPPPSTPSNLAATAASSSQINLSWTASTDTGGPGLAGYQVWRCSGTGCSNFAQVATPTTNSYSDTGLTASTSYTYEVRAVDTAATTSAFSSTSSATTSSGSVSIAYVQGNYATPHPSASSVAVTYSAVAQGAGDLNVVAVGWCDTTSTVTSITDSKGNAYARAIGPTVVSGSASQSVYYAQNIAAAAAGANVVTVTFSGTVTCPDVRILEYSGIATSNALDVTVGGSSATGTALSSNSVTTTNANDLLIGSSFIGQSPNGVGTGYTQRVLSTPNGNLEEDKIVSSTGSYSATAAQTPSSWWIMQLTAFKAASGTPPPSTPTNLVATAASASQVNLSWTASTDTGGPGLAGYQVWRCSGAGCSNFAQVGTPTTSSYSDTGLTASTSYTYEVRAVDTAGLTSAYSATSTATTGSGAASIGYVQGNYATPHPSASSVAVTYSTAAQGAGDLNVVVVGWCDATSTVSIADSKGNTYTRAMGPTQVSGSASQSVYYAQNIAAAAAGANTVTATFSGTVSCPDVRILEYSGIATSNALDVTVGGSSATGTALSSNSVTTTNANDLLIGSSFIGQSPNGVGTGYTQRVLSTPNGNLEEDKIVSSTGSYSATAVQTPSSWWIMQLTAFKAASTDTTPPSAPTGLTATVVSSTQINLSWTASTDNVGVTGYVLQRCSGASCTSFAQIATPTATTYSDTGLTASTPYSYRVEAKDAAGNLSAWSSTATATTQSSGSSSSGGSSSGGSSSGSSSSGGSSSGSSSGSSGGSSGSGAATYHYDSNGHLTSITYASSGGVTYTYDAAGNFSSIQVH